jgi:hypothetical protein
VRSTLRGWREGGPPLEASLANRTDHGRCMIAESNSNIAWHRVQLRKNREAVKALEIARFRVGDIAGPAGQAQQRAIAHLKRKIAESERCIAAHERRTKRPLATDLQSLARVSWCNWNTHGPSRQAPPRA